MSEEPDRIDLLESEIDGLQGELLDKVDECENLRGDLRCEEQAVSVLKARIARTENERDISRLAGKKLKEVIVEVIKTLQSESIAAVIN